MPRKATGQVVELDRARGRVFALRFRAYGQRRYLTLGSAEEGWTREKAEARLRHTLADVERGTWRPPEPEPEAPEPRREPTFHEFASEWFEANKGEWRENTRLDYHWQLTHHLLPFFARHRLSAITVEEVDRYRQAKVMEGALSPTSINKTITRLGQVLEVAVEYGHVPRNVAQGKRRRVKATTPQRNFLDRAEQVEALLVAAGELDASARSDYRGLGRRALLATLVFAGLRIGEALPLRWRDVDLAGGRLRVGEAKTDAGVRGSSCCQPSATRWPSTRRERATPAPTRSSSRRPRARGRPPRTSASASSRRRSRRPTSDSTGTRGRRYRHG